MTTSLVINHPKNIMAQWVGSNGQVKEKVRKGVVKLIEYNLLYIIKNCNIVQESSLLCLGLLFERDIQFTFNVSI